MKRVVVTGIGVVSCLGNNQKEVYDSLVNTKSGISFAEEYKEHNLKSNVHGKPNIKLEDHVDRKALRFMGNGSAYNFVAMKEALQDSGLKEKLKKCLQDFNRITSDCTMPGPNVTTAQLQSNYNKS